jgi:hypothetical protein
MGTFLCVSQFVSEINYNSLKTVNNHFKAHRIFLFRSVLPHLVAEGGDLGLGYDSIAFSARRDESPLPSFHNILPHSYLRRFTISEVFSIDFPAVSLRSTQKNHGKTQRCQKIADFRRSEVVACEKASEWAKALQLFPGDATTPRRHDATEWEASCFTFVCYNVNMDINGINTHYGFYGFNI